MGGTSGLGSEQPIPQYQLGFLGLGGHTGFAGTKLSRFGILTFGRLVASMTSVS